MDQPLESIAMWKLYSNMESGVRSALRRNPFERYTAAKEDLQKAFYGIEVQGESIDFSQIGMRDVFRDAYADEQKLQRYKL